MEQDNKTDLPEREQRGSTIGIVDPREGDDE